MIRDEIVTYEVAKLAKEKGFYGRSSYVYNSEKILLGVKGVVNWCKVEFVAPTQSLLQRWLREEKKVEVYVRHFEEANKYPHHFGTIITDDKGETLEIGGKMFDSYELALEDVLKYALENLV